VKRNFNTHTLWFKTLAVVVLCLFVFNNLTYAIEPQVQYKNTYKLAPPTPFGTDRDDGPDDLPGPGGTARPDLGDAGSAADPKGEAAADDDSKTLFRSRADITYLNLKIWQFLKRYGSGMSADVLRGFLLDHIQKHKIQIDFSKVLLGDLRKEGKTFFLPYIDESGEVVETPYCLPQDMPAEEARLHTAVPKSTVEDIFAEAALAQATEEAVAEPVVQARQREEEVSGTYKVAYAFYRMLGIHNPSKRLIGLFASLYELVHTLRPIKFILRRHKNKTWGDIAWRAVGVGLIYSAMILVPCIALHYGNLYPAWNIFNAEILGSVAVPVSNVTMHALYNILALPLGLPMLIEDDNGDQPGFGEVYNPPKNEERKDYLTALKIKFLKELRIPEQDALLYSKKIRELHTSIQEKVIDYYGESENQIRYTLTPRELHRIADEFIRMTNKARKDGKSHGAALRWAFDRAAQNVYYDLFPRDFFDHTGVKESAPKLEDYELPFGASPGREWLDSVSIYKDAYSKICRGLNTDKPLLLIKDVESHDTAKVATDIYVRQRSGVLVTVPITPFTDRAQIIGTQVPKDVLSEKEINKIIEKANEDKIRFALAIMRAKIPHGTKELTRAVLHKATKDEYAEWEMLKDSHFGLRRAVAATIAYHWGWNQKVTYEEGILAKMASMAEKMKDQQYYLYFDNIDAASPKVRAQLNQILLFSEMEVPEKFGKVRKLKLPENLHLIFTMSETSVLEDAAFYDRFLRKHINGLWQPEKSSVSQAFLGRLLTHIQDQKPLKRLIKESVDKLIQHDFDKLDNDIEMTLSRHHMRRTLTVTHSAFDISHEDINTFIGFLCDHPDQALQLGYISESQALLLLPTRFEAERLPLQADIENILRLRYKLPVKQCKLLLLFWREFMGAMKFSEASEAMHIGDLFNIARYAVGAEGAFRSTKPVRDADELWRQVIAREAQLYLHGKLGGYCDKEPILERRITDYIKRIGASHVASIGEHLHILDGSNHTLTIDGISIDIDPNITDEESLFKRTGLVLTSETIKVLSALIREQLFGTGVVCLEGPTGTGKTFIAEAFSKLTSTDGRGKYKKRRFYCEPIHGSTRIDRWLGHYTVDQWGNYPFFGDTEFQRALAEGGVVAASELNARVNRDAQASLGFWLIPKARGDRVVPLTEYPRRPKDGTAFISPVLEMDPKSLVVIDINPQETYAARGELPDFLKAFIPTLYVKGMLPLADLYKMGKFFLGNAKMTDELRTMITVVLGQVHHGLQRAIEKKKIGKDADYAITIRELFRTAEDITRIVNEKKMSTRDGMELALIENYANFWLQEADRQRARDIIQEVIGKVLKTAPTQSILSKIKTKKPGLTDQEQFILRYVKDSLVDAGRPTMLLSPIDSRPEKIVSTLIKENDLKSESMTISYFTELFHLVGGFVPVNQDMKPAGAEKIIERMIIINARRVQEIWKTKMGKAEELREASPGDKVILATALNSLEMDEEWNAQLSWQEGVITRAVKKCGKMDKNLVLILRNYHRLRPKVAVALNELLQGRQLHLEDGTVLTLPKNFRILALGGSDFKLPLSLAEQSRWVRVVAPGLPQAHQEALLRGTIAAKLAQNSAELTFNKVNLDRKIIGEMAASIENKVLSERNMINNACVKGEYYFSFWDDIALARAVCEHLIEQKNITTASIGIAVGKERESVFGIALREEDLKSYMPVKDFFNENDGRIETKDGVLSIDGVLYDIVNKELEESTRDTRLVDIPRLVATERSMLRAFKQNRIVILEGPPGGGKTETAVDLFNRMGLESFLYSSHDRVHLQDLIGEYTQDETGNFVLTSTPDENGHFTVPFLEHFVHGGGYIIDEGAIGRRAQELIAWLGPIAAGQKELYLQEHPGKEPIKLTRHSDFQVVITTNPYGETPGRESLPFEVLGFAQKIWLRKEFTRKDFTRILISLFGDLDMEGTKKADIIERMINFHFAVERNIPTKLGQHHEERFYIGIRELTHWANDLVRIYTEMKTPNSELALVEAMMLNYNIFVDKEEEMFFKDLVFRRLLATRLKSAVKEIAGIARKSGDFTLKPIYEFIQAYQIILQDNRVRRDITDKINAELQAQLGFVPEFSMHQYLDFTGRRVEEQEESQRELAGDYYSSSKMAELYADLDNEEKALNSAKYVIALVEERLEADDATSPETWKKDMDDLAMAWLYDTTRSMPNASSFGTLFMTLLTTGEIFEKYNDEEKLLKTMELMTTIMERGLLTQVDLQYCFPNSAKRFFHLLTLLPEEKRVIASQKIDEFVQKAYKANDIENPELDLAWHSVCVHFAQIHAVHNKTKVESILAELIQKYIEAFKKLRGSFYHDKKYRFGQFWAEILSICHMLAPELREKIFKQVGKIFARKTTGGKFWYLGEDRIVIALSMARTYAALGEKKNAKTWSILAMDEIERCFGEVALGKMVEVLRMPDVPLSSLRGVAREVETFFGEKKPKTFFKELGKYTAARRYLLEIADLTPLLEEEHREDLLDKIRTIMPPSIVESLYVTMAERKAMWEKEQSMHKYWLSTLRTVYLEPDQTELILNKYENPPKKPVPKQETDEYVLQEPYHYKERILAALNLLAIERGGVGMKEREINFVLESFAEIIRQIRRIEGTDKETLIAEVFRKISQISLATIDSNFNDEQRRRFFSILSWIRAMYTLDESLIKEADRMSLGLREVSEAAAKSAKEYRDFTVTEEDGHLKIGTVRLPKGNPLDPERVPKNVPWVDGIYTEETALRFLLNSYYSHRPGLFFCQPGSRARDVIEKSAEMLDYELYPINCYDGMSVNDLVGGLSPILDAEKVARKKLAQERGLLSSHLVEEDDKHKETTRKIIVFYNIDFLNEKVRAALHNFLLKGYVYVNDDSGRRIKLVQPDGLHIVATMASESDKEISDAFFNRFNRSKLSALEMEKIRFTELELVLRALYGVNMTIARYIVRILFGVMVLDEQLLWPSGIRYGFSIKDALALGRYFVQARKAYKEKGIDISDNKILCQEAFRLFGSALNDASDDKGATDRNEFERLILRRSFQSSDISILGHSLIVNSDAKLQEMQGVKTLSTQDAQPIFELDPRYRLSFVSSLVTTAGSLFRAWQPAWDTFMNRMRTVETPDVVVITGETGVAKTTLGINLALSMGVKPYVYSTHQGSHSSDLTVDIAPDDIGGYSTRIKDFAYMARKGNCVLIIDEGNIKAQVIQTVASQARGERILQLVIPGDGRRLNSLLLHILGEDSDMDVLYQKLKQFKFELFGAKDKEFAKLLETFGQLSDDDQKSALLPEFFEFAKTLRISGLIEVEIGKNVMILVTQNPDAYAGRDLVDPVILEDSRKLWAPALRDKGETAAVVDSFLGVLNPSLIDEVSVVDAVSMPPEEPPLDAFTASSSPFEEEGSIVDRATMLTRKKEIQAKIALIQRDVAFFTSKDIVILAGKGFAISADGTKMWIPYHQLIYSSPEVITGSIIHEIRHQRYTPSNVEFEILIDDLVREGSITKEDGARLRNIFQDQFMNVLFQLAENVRTDTIVEPGFEGENDYLQTFRKERFMDNRLDSLPKRERPKFEKKLLKWAEEFPNQAFLSELCNLAYFGKYSDVFDKYPQEVQDAVKGASDAFLFATADKAVKPDFDNITTDEEFEASKLAVAKEYFKRMTAVIPVYLEMVEKAKPAYEEEKKRAEAQTADFIGHMEPFVEIKEEKKGEGEEAEVRQKVVRTKTQADLEHKQIQGMDRLKRLLEDGKEIKNRSLKYPSIKEQYKHIQKMQSLLEEARECVGGLIQLGLSEERLAAAFEIRGLIYSIFDDMVIHLWESSKEEAKNYPEGHKKITDLAKQAKKWLKQVKAFSAACDKIIELMNDDSTISDLCTMRENLVKKQKRLDMSLVGLANRIVSQEDLEVVRHASANVQAYIDKIDEALGMQQAIQIVDKIQKEMISASLIQRLAQFQAIADHWDRVIDSNPMHDSLLDAQRELGKILMQVQRIILELAQSGMTEGGMEQAVETRKKIVDTIRKAEDVTRVLTATEDRKPEADQSYEERQEAHKLITEGMQTIQNIKDVAVTKTVLEDLINCSIMMGKELRRVQEAIFALVNNGVSEREVGEGQQVRDLSIQYSDDILGMIVRKAREQSEQVGQPVNPGEEELKKIRELVQKSKNAYDSVTAKEDEEIAVKELTDRINSLSKNMEDILISLHKVAYLGAPDKLMEDMFGACQQVMRWSDELLLRVRNLMMGRVEETQGEADEVISDVSEAYRKHQGQLSRCSPEDPIVDLNSIEHQIMLFYSTLNEKLNVLAGYGANIEEFRHIMAYRNRILQAILNVEKILRDRRMLLAHGAQTGQLEALIMKMLQSSNEVMLKLEKEPTLTNANTALTEIDQYIGGINHLIIQMYGSGTLFSLIQQAIAARDNILDMRDRVLYVINKETKDTDLPEDYETEIAEHTLKAAQLWQGIKDKRDGFIENPTDDNLAIVLRAAQDILVVLEALSRLKAPEDEIKKGIFSRKEIFQILDDVGLALRDSVSQETRLTGESQAPPPIGEQGPNPEDKLDTMLSELLDKTQKEVEDVGKKPKQSRILKGVKNLGKFIGQIDILILQLSQHGADETLIDRCTDARTRIWDFLKDLSDLAKQANQYKKESPGEKLSDLEKEFRRIVSECNKAEASVNELTPPEMIAMAFTSIYGGIIQGFMLFDKWNAVAREDSLDLDRTVIESMHASYDKLGAILRQMVRAYMQMAPPPPGSQSSAGMGGSGAAGMASGQSGIMSVGGQLVSQGATGGAAGAGSAAGAGKGAPDRGGLTPVEDRGDMDDREGGKRSPLDLPPEMDAPPERDVMKDETPDPNQTMEQYQQRLVQDRMKEIREKDSLRGRMAKGSGRARKDAEQVIRLFKQKDAEILEEEAPTGLKINVPRFIRKSQEPFDIEYEFLGDISLAFGLYVDNSGSMSAIREYVADAAAYLIHLFEGISSTRTGKDKFSYGIKTFDTGLNSFKGFNERVTRSEAMAIPANVRGILGRGGTDISLCIREILGDFDSVKEKTKVAILLTDGQDSVNPGLARMAEEKGIILIGVGVGSYSANVKNIFNRYLLFSDPKNELPEAIVKLAALLATGKKLPRGNLREILGIAADSAMVERLEGGMDAYFRGPMITRDEYALQAENVAVGIFPEGSPYEMRNLLQAIGQDGAYDDEDGITPVAMRPRTTGRSEGHLALATIKRDLGTLRFLGLVDKKGRGDTAKYKAVEIPEWAEEFVQEVLRTLKDRPSAAEKKEARDVLNAFFAEKDAQDFIKEILSHVDEAKHAQPGKKDILVGIETSWIPGIQKPAIQSLINVLNKMSRKQGLGNIRIIRRKDGKTLARDLLAIARDEGIDLSNVILLGDKKGLGPKTPSLRELRNPSDGQVGAFFWEINMPADFPETGNIQLLQMIKDAMNMALKGDGPRFHEFIPTSKPYDLQVLKKIYKVKRQVITAA